MSDFAYPLHEECGVFGIYDRAGTEDVAAAAYSALYALQHRGQESCFIEVIKKAEDGDGVIVRMYENKNNRVRAHITSGRALVHVYECNLLEEKEAELTVCGTTFETVFKPYEIKTFRLIFA